MVWTPPPNWPPPPHPGWQPPPGWQPDPRWGPPPPGWNFWPQHQSWLSRHVALVAVLAVLAVLALAGVIGLAANVDTGQSSEPQAPSATAASQPDQAETRDAARVRRAEHYLRQNFRRTSWYAYIKHMEMNGHQVWVTTNLYPDSDADYPASAICSALSGWEVMEFGKPTGVRVATKSGQRLVWSRGLGDTCD